MKKTFVFVVGVLGVSLVGSIIATGMLAYYLKNDNSKANYKSSNNDNQMPFPHLNQSEICRTCLSRLSEDQNVDLNTRCSQVIDMFECAEQLVYLYNGPDNKQPYYQECYACAQYLTENDVFEMRSDVVRSPSTLLRGWTDTALVQHENHGIFCHMNLTKTVFKDKIKDGGMEWYPVWFNIPWEKPHLHRQSYYQAKCSLGTGACNDAKTCTEGGLTFPFVMSNEKPDPTFGYTFKFLTALTVKFLFVPIPSYCYGIQ